ncbi:MRO2A protein, partial [Trogon melanurus]|nr:MRO2A protein [Trogon melanurus]
QGDRLEAYRELEGALQGQDSCLQKSGVVNRLIAEASSDLRAAQGVTDDVRMAASDVLVALARSHFHFVMPELQSHLKAMRKDPDEAVLLTLAKMARSYALRCIPFVGMTLLALRAVLSRVGSGGTLRAVCRVLEQWSHGVNAYFCSRERCPFPGKGEAQLCEDVYPIFDYVVANWLGCEEEEDKQAVLGAMAAMMRVLLHDERHRQHACEQLPWLLLQYGQVPDTSLVTKSLNSVLEKLEGLKTPLSQGTVLAVSTAVHRQVRGTLASSWPAGALQLPADAQHGFLPAARSCPEETMAFLQSQLSAGSPRGRAAAVGLLRVLARSEAPAVREKLPQVVEAMRSLCKDPSAKVQLAVVQFIRELLSCVPQRCWAWDVVGHVFDEFTRTSGRLVRAE